MERAEHYKAEIPEGVLLLTAAVDVQNNRFEVEVKGWARDYESWGIHKTEIYGNLETEEIYAQAIVDFISGMTDRYAVTVFNELLRY